jgi:hypothetical protein
MLQWVIEKAQKAAQNIKDANIIVASENDEILQFAKKLNTIGIKTSEIAKQAQIVFGAQSINYQKSLHIF